MGRVLSALITLAIASAPAFVAGAYVVAPAVTTTAAADTGSASAKTVTTANVVRTQQAATTTTSAASTTTTTATIATASVATTGNGAPNGSHYNLNIIGVPKDKTADMNNNDGHRIFVQLNGGAAAADVTGKNFADISKVNTILLAPAPVGGSFQVLDANATDKNGAVFQLPADVSTTWTVWARALGKPRGTADMTTWQP
jgi:hypothetical protein